VLQVGTRQARGGEPAAGREEGRGGTKTFQRDLAVF
jgi:hypothetical protein